MNVSYNLRKILRRLALLFALILSRSQGPIPRQDANSHQ
jgi:hypothetical protein